MGFHIRGRFYSNETGGDYAVIFANVKNIVIPEGNVKQISRNGEIIWKSESGGLPGAYQQVEYIESTGTQYIDTGVAGSNTLTFDIKFLSKNSFNVSSFGTIFGSRKNSWTSQYQLTSYGTSTGGGQFRWSSSTYNNLYMKTNEIMHVSMDGSKFYRNDGTSFNCTQPAAFSGFSITLFALNEIDSGKPVQFGKVQLYSLKFYENGVLIRDFVPCYRKRDNEIGLYDLVEGVFYTNAGTGTFLKGQDIN